MLYNHCIHYSPVTVESDLGVLGAAVASIFGVAVVLVVAERPLSAARGVVRFLSSSSRHREVVGVVAAAATKGGDGGGRDEVRGGGG